MLKLTAVRSWLEKGLVGLRPTLRKLQPSIPKSRLLGIASSLASASLLAGMFVVLTPVAASATSTNFTPGSSISSAAGHCFRGYSFKPSRAMTITHLIGGGNAPGFIGALYGPSSSASTVGPILRDAAYGGSSVHQQVKVTDVELEANKWYFIGQVRSSGNGSHHTYSFLTKSTILANNPFLADWSPGDDDNYVSTTCTGHQSTYANKGVSVDNVRPAVGFTYIAGPDVSSATVETPSGNPTNATTYQYRIIWNQGVSGFTTSDITPLINGSTTSAFSKSLASSSTSSYLLTLTRNTSVTGTLSIRINRAGVSASTGGLVGTGTFTSSGSTGTRLIDTSPPSISLFTVTGALTNDPTLVFRVESNETLSPTPATGNFSVPSPCVVSSITNHSTNQWNVNVTGCDDDQDVALTLNQNALRDPAGNAAPSSPITTASIHTDYTNPTITAVRPATPTNALSHPYTFTPSESLNREIELADFVFSQTQGTGCAIDPDSFSKDAPAAGNYSLSVECDAATAHDSTFSVTMAQGSSAGGATLTDLAGNQALAISSTDTEVSIDRFSTISSITADPNPANGFTNASNVDYTITFSEPVKNLIMDQLSVGGPSCELSILSPANPQDASQTFTQAVVRAANCADGEDLNFQITPAANGLFDALGNIALNGPTTFSQISIDRTAPELVSTLANASAANNFHNSSTLSYNINFDEVVTGLTAAMFTAATCSGTPVLAGSGDSYQITFSNCADGAVSPIATLTEDVIDRATNPLTAQVVNLTTVTVDTVAPTSSWESVASSLTRASSIQFAINFNEPVIASTFSGSNITNVGSATGCSFTVAEDTQTQGVTPGTRFFVTATSCSDLGSSSTLQPRILDGLVTDLAGNPLSQTLELRTAETVTLDQTIPVATFDSSPPSRTNQDLNYALSFSEPIASLSDSDLSFTGSSQGCEIALVADASNPTTQFDITLTNCSDGTVRLTLASNSAVDDAGNAGPSFDLEATVVTVDTVAATATIAATGGITKSRDSFVSFDITFNEPVYNLVANSSAFELSGTGCQLGTLTPAGLTSFSQAVANYSLTITNCADATNAALSLKPNAVIDVAGNLSPAAVSNAASIEIDRVPAEVLSFTAAEPDELGRVIFTLTFNEPVNDSSLSAADFEKTSASVPLVTPFTVERISTTVYEITAQALTDGDASIQLKALSITDAIGNASPASAEPSEVATMELPELSGAFSLSPSVNPAGYSNATTLRYELAISRAIDTSDVTKTLVASDLELGGISCANTTITPLAAYLLAIELTGCDNGEITLAIKPNSITDPDGDSWPQTELAAATVLYDTTKPTVTITKPNNTQYLVRHEFTLTFSEPVFGLTAADITLAAGSTATGCQFGYRTITASQYKVIASSCTNGTIAITLNQDSVVDRAGNLGPASAASSQSITQSPPPAAPTGTRIVPDDPTDPNSPNYDPNAEPLEMPSMLARAPERFIGPITSETQEQLAQAGFIRVSDPDQFAQSSVFASFAALPTWNTPAHLTKTMTVQAGEVVDIEVQINAAGQGYMKAQGYLQTEDGWLDLGVHEFDEGSSVLSVPAMFALPGSYFIRVAMIETGAPPSLNVMSFGQFATASFVPASFAAQNNLTDEAVMSMGTQALEISVNVTGSPVTLLDPPRAQPTFDGPIFDNLPVTVTSLGGSATLTGQKLTVSSATVAGQQIRIDQNTATALVLAIPALSPGSYDLIITWSGGKLTVQDALIVIAVEEALAGITSSNFITRHIGNNQVKVYAKDIVSLGKIQFMVNGKEIAWIRADSETDPKLRFANNSHYLVRTVDLAPGKNRIEIRVNGLRAKFATYVGED